MLIYLILEYVYRFNESEVGLLKILLYLIGYGVVKILIGYM